MTDKEREIELAYKELKDSLPQATEDKIDYWADYEEAQWQQYEQEQAKFDAEEQAIIDELEAESANSADAAKKQSPDQYTIIQQKPIYWDVSGDDSSLNPDFW